MASLGSPFSKLQRRPKLRWTPDLPHDNFMSLGWIEVRSTLEHESIARDLIQIVQKNGSRRKSCQFRSLMWHLPNWQSGTWFVARYTRTIWKRLEYVASKGVFERVNETAACRKVCKANIDELPKVINSCECCWKLSVCRCLWYNLDAGDRCC